MHVCVYIYIYIYKIENFIEKTDSLFMTWRNDTSITKQKRKKKRILFPFLFSMNFPFLCDIFPIDLTSRYQRQLKTFVIKSVN